MTTIQAQVPDALAREVTELAEREKVTIDQLVNIALVSQIGAWRKRDTIAERAKRGSWDNFDQEAQEVTALYGIVHVLGQRAGGSESGLLAQLRQHHADDVAALVHQRAAGVGSLDGYAELEIPRVILHSREASSLSDLGSIPNPSGGGRYWCREK